MASTWRRSTGPGRCDGLPTAQPFGNASGRAAGAAGAVGAASSVGSAKRTILTVTGSSRSLSCGGTSFQRARVFSQKIAAVTA